MISSYLFITSFINWKFFLMDDKNKWMLMTYYCPIHGDLGIVKPIEITKKEISEKFLKKGKASRITYVKHT